MFYRLSNTSLKDNNLVLFCNWSFARLIDCMSSLLDIIFSVSLILRQSSMLRTTDFGLPSEFVMNSTSGNSRVLGIVTSPCSLLTVSLAKSRGRVNKWKLKPKGSSSEDLKFFTSAHQLFSSLELQHFSAWL